MILRGMRFTRPSHARGFRTLIGSRTKLRHYTHDGRMSSSLRAFCSAANEGWSDSPISVVTNRDLNRFSVYHVRSVQLAIAAVYRFPQTVPRGVSRPMTSDWYEELWPLSTWLLAWTRSSRFTLCQPTPSAILFTSGRRPTPSAARTPSALPSLRQRKTFPFPPLRTSALWARWATADIR